MSKSEIKWTPGPYEISGTTVYVLNEHGTNRITAQVQPGWEWKDGTGIEGDDRRTSEEEAKATAQLFTAAPELYEALVEYMFAVEQMNAVMRDGGNVQGAMAMLVAAEHATHTALAKARGELKDQ